MTDRPIIFSAPMVRALLNGRKTQTRRLATSPLRRCEVGDRLYVRENWRVSPEAGEAWHPAEMRGWIDYQAGGSLEVVAPSFDDVERATFLKGEEHDWDFIPSRYRPCIHMPRWASRLTLIVEDVRFESLQEITEEDARAESFEEGVLDDGFSHTYPDGTVVSIPGTYASAVGMFLLTFQELHPEWDGYDDLPVVALTFRVERGNIDQLSAGGA